MIQRKELNERSKELLVEYCKTKYNNEQEIKNFKKSSKEELKKLLTNIKNGISKQNLENYRVIYQNSNNNRFSLDNISDIENPEYIAIEIFNLLIKNISMSSSNNMIFHRGRYLESELEIINYYKRYFEIKFELEELKLILNRKLKNVIIKLKKEQTPAYIARYMYGRLKQDTKIINVDETELEYCENTYNEIKTDLLNIIKDSIKN